MATRQSLVPSAQTWGGEMVLNGFYASLHIFLILKRHIGLVMPFFLNIQDNKSCVNWFFLHEDFSDHCYFVLEEEMKSHESALSDLTNPPLSPLNFREIDNIQQQHMTFSTPELQSSPSVWHRGIYSTNSGERCQTHSRSSFISDVASPELPVASGYRVECVLLNLDTGMDAGILKRAKKICRSDKAFLIGRILEDNIYIYFF